MTLTETKKQVQKSILQKGQIAFVLIIYLLSYFVGEYNIDLFEISQDFAANKYMITNEGYGLTKGIFYYAYLVFFDQILKEDQYLVLIWSIVPAGAASALFIIINEMGELKSVPGRYVLFLMQVSIFYLLVLRFIANDLMIPTAHLLFQSASSVIVILAILYRHKSIFLYYLLGFLAINLHYSAGMYLIIFHTYHVLVIKNVEMHNYIGFGKALRKGTLGIALLILYLYLFVLVSEEFRGYSGDELLGVDDALMSVIYISLIVSGAALVLSRAYLGVTMLGYGKDRLGFYILIKMLFAISLISIGMAMYHQGLGYRVNYIVYVASPIIAMVMVVVLIKLGIKRNV